MLKIWLYEIYKESTKQPSFTYDEWLAKTAGDASSSGGASASAVHVTLAVVLGMAIGFGGAHYYNKVKKD